MNPETLLSLCEFSYYDLPETYIRRLQRGETVYLRDVADALGRIYALGALACGTYREYAGETFSSLKNSPLEIVAYQNDNATNGFVGYAFLAGDGEIVVAVRGSESRRACQPPKVDWRDNLCAPFSGSAQYAPAVRFANRFPAQALILTGHSKGGNVAMYAQSAAENPLARAAVFNAQGFGPGQLSPAEKRRLHAGAVNYVISSDKIGALLFHPERRVFVEGRPGVNAHSPQAYVFNARGFPVPARRSIGSYLVGFASRMLLIVHAAVPGGPVGEMLRYLTDSVLQCPRPIADS